MSEIEQPIDIAQIKPRVNEFKRFYRVFTSRWLVMFGSVVILLFLIVAAFGPLIAPYDPNAQQLDKVLAAPSSEHLLGTDEFGRDILSRLIYGARPSLLVGLVATGMAALIGGVAGLIAAYLGGWVYAVIMRIIDALMSFPMIVLALIIAALLGNGLGNVMIALGVAMIPGYARLMSGLVLSVKENDYVLAARSLGVGNLRIMLCHILHNCFSPIIVMITLQIGAAILLESGLSYLGIGIAPPTPTWGSMIANGYRYLMSNPLLSFAPGIALMVAVFSFNMVGDGLRDTLDPSLRGVL